MKPIASFEDDESADAHAKANHISTTQKWRTFKRYNDFYELHKSLSKALKEEEKKYRRRSESTGRRRSSGSHNLLPSLPSKQLIQVASKWNESFLEDRRVALEGK